MKKAVSLMMAAAMTMGLAACGSTASTDTAASAADTASSTEAAASTADSTAAADGKVYNIGICQLVQHEALDAATQGFKDALVEKLGEGSVKFDEQNASGDSANCATIVNGFVSNGVDLILANATAPLQAAAQATADIPVLGTSITDYATALDISDWTGTVGNNISGTSDLAPLDQQAAMIQEMFPNAKFIYLKRNPYTVFESTRSFFTNTIQPLRLQDITNEQIEANFIEVYRRLFYKYEEEKHLIPEGNLVEVKFEDFEKDAFAMTENIYGTLNLPGFKESKADIEKYLGKKKGYKKNQYKYEDRTVRLVEENWGMALKEWGYSL